MVRINQFKASTLEMLANAIADIDPGITGSVIHRMLMTRNQRNFIILVR